MYNQSSKSLGLTDCTEFAVLLSITFREELPSYRVQPKVSRLMYGSLTCSILCPMSAKASFG